MYLLDFYNIFHEELNRFWTIVRSLVMKSSVIVLMIFFVTLDLKFISPCYSE